MRRRCAVSLPCRSLASVKPWVAGSHKLWKSGADVFLSKDGETFKELKSADYIPVGATLNVDGSSAESKRLILPLMKSG